MAGVVQPPLHDFTRQLVRVFPLVLRGRVVAARRHFVRAVRVRVEDVFGDTGIGAVSFLNAARKVGLFGARRGILPFGVFMREEILIAHRLAVILRHARQRRVPGQLLFVSLRTHGVDALVNAAGQFVQLVAGLFLRLWLRPRVGGVGVPAATGAPHGNQQGREHDLCGARAHDSVRD